MNNNQDNFEEIKYNYFLDQLKQLIPDIKNFNEMSKTMDKTYYEMLGIILFNTIWTVGLVSANYYIDSSISAFMASFLGMTISLTGLFMIISYMILTPIAWVKLELKRKKLNQKILHFIKLSSDNAETIEALFRKKTNNNTSSKLNDFFLTIKQNLFVNDKTNKQQLDSISDLYEIIEDTQNKKELMSILSQPKRDNNIISMFHN